MSIRLGQFVGSKINSKKNCPKNHGSKINQYRAVISILTLYYINIL